MYRFSRSCEAIISLLSKTYVAGSIVFPYEFVVFVKEYVFLPEDFQRNIFFFKSGQFNIDESKLL